MRHAARLFLLVLALAVCAPQTTPAQSPTPDSPTYGAYPENYQELVTAWLNASMVDHESIRLKFLGAPKPGVLAVGNQKVAGYLVEFSVNARNIFGAFTGSQKHTALVRDGQVLTATGFLSR